MLKIIRQGPVAVSTPRGGVMGSRYKVGKSREKTAEQERRKAAKTTAEHRATIRQATFEQGAPDLPGEEQLDMHFRAAKVHESIGHRS